MVCPIDIQVGGRQQRDLAGAGIEKEGEVKPGQDDSSAMKEGDKPVEVRFLDVPGSEETRAEKMTVVFTCTVGIRFYIFFSFLSGCLFIAFVSVLSVSCTGIYFLFLLSQPF